MRKAWWKWAKIVKIVVGFQTSILLFVIYYIMVIPVAFLIKIFSKRTLLGHSHNLKAKSYWNIRSKSKHNLLWARSQ